MYIIDIQSRHSTDNTAPHNAISPVGPLAINILAGISMKNAHFMYFLYIVLILRLKSGPPSLKGHTELQT